MTRPPNPAETLVAFESFTAEQAGDAFPDPEASLAQIHQVLESDREYQSLAVEFEVDPMSMIEKLIAGGTDMSTERELLLAEWALDGAERSVNVTKWLFRIRMARGTLVSRWLEQGEAGEPHASRNFLKGENGVT